MKINLLKKELVVGTIFLLLLATMPHIVSNDLPSATAYTDDLVVKVTTDKEIYYPGEPVIITISVTNYGPNTTLVFATSQHANFKVTKPYGRHVFRWAWHCMFAQVITNVPIKQGETKVLRNWTWYKLRDFYPFFPLPHVPVLPGKYYINGWMVRGFSHPKINGEPVEVTLRWFTFA